MATEKLEGIKFTDVRGNLETIEHLAQVGILLMDLGYQQHIPTILEDIYEHAQRLTLEYAVDGTEKEGEISI